MKNNIYVHKKWFEMATLIFFLRHEKNNDPIQSYLSHLRITQNEKFQS